MIRRVAITCARDVWQLGAQVPKVAPVINLRCNSYCSQLQSRASSRCRASLALNATEFAVAMQLILGPPSPSMVSAVCTRRSRDVPKVPWMVPK
jgi:hypothetical protein